MKNIKYILITLLGLFLVNEIYSQCPSGSVINSPTLLTTAGTVAPVPFTGNTDYKLRVTFSSAPGGSVNSIRLNVADGVGFVSYVGGPFSYIPPALAVDMGGSQSSPVYFNVRTVPQEDLGTGIYVSFRFTCTGGTQGTIRQYSIPTQ